MRREHDTAETEKTEPNGDWIIHLATFLWRWRWQLVPPVMVAVILCSATDYPGSMAVTATLVAAVAGTAASREGDTLLHRAERQALMIGGIITAIWAVVIWATPLEVGPRTATVLALLMIWPTYGWCWSRWPGRNTEDDIPEQTDLMIHVLEQWPVVAEDGPKVLRQSEIVMDSLSEPTPGAVTFTVHLARGVHCKDATGASTRQVVESLLELPTDTTQIETCRENSRRIVVTLTPQRNLETTDATWDGPILEADGTIPLAVDDKGASADVGLYNAAGVEHAIITGTTGVGKSNTLSAMILPGVMNDVEVVAYIDGGMGSSAPHLQPACDWWAVDSVDQWVAVIDSVHAVMRARKSARAKAGLSAWRGQQESDPIVTLVIDEATTVLRELQASRNLDAADRVLEILREGRKLGVRCIQIAQDPMGADLIGGRQARSLAAGGGSMIAHRPGDGTANMLAGGSTADSVDLRTLPPGPGWCAIIRKGVVVSARARIRYASETAVREALEDFRCRQLAGADRVAAGAPYTARTAVVADDTTPEIDQGTSLPVNGGSTHKPRSLEQSLATLAASTKRVKRETGDNNLSGSQRAAASTAAANAATIRSVLDRGGAEGIRRNALDAELTGQMSRATITRTLAKLAEDGAVTKTDHGVWKTVSS